MNNLNLKKRKFFPQIGFFSIFIFLYPIISTEIVNSSEGNILNAKCPSLKIKKFTYITFDKIEKSNLIDLNNVNCQDVLLIDNLESSKVNITTGRKSGKAVSSSSDIYFRRFKIIYQ